MSCSRKKDKFINRNFHALTARDNILYNGKIALEQGREELNQSYQDNYWDILPIERMQVLDEIRMPGQSKNESFNRAEEKAIKAIQKHGMNIGGRERNPQMDEAYLLLGKARYFDQRFIPALEAFNYILYKYPASDKIDQARIWREKTNLRLENNKLVVRNLNHFIENAELDDQNLADASATLAQAYINTEVIDTAITHLKVAADFTKSKDERGRYLFIQGQLYNQLGYKDSANTAFDKVIELNRKTPRIYMISAHLEKVKNFNYDSNDSLKLEVVELLEKLENNRENRPYLDKIYHRIAEFNRGLTNDSLAVVNYNKSLRTNSPDKLLVAKNYEILGDMNFDKYIYKTAGDYYDSTMANLDKNSKEIRIIKRKRDNLDDVIYYEAIAKETDSILHLVNLSEEDRFAYFKAYTDELKLQDEKEKKRAKAMEAQKRNNGIAMSTNQVTSSINRNRNSQASTFYFYNTNTVSYGKNEFAKIWGDRPNEDNWRWSTSKKSSVLNQSSGNDLASIDDEKNQMFDPEFYIASIPTDEKIVDSIYKERNESYYQLGLIYKEKFKEYELAKVKFEDLLDSKPEERLILPSKYNLFKVYKILEMSSKAEAIKEDIISNYPESRYAEILMNPELIIDSDQNSPECIYENLHIKFNNQEYKEVISKSDDYITRFYGEPIVPKFEMLKASSIGRLEGFQAYVKAINNVVLTYPNTDEGKEAKKIQNEVFPLLSKSTFVKYEDNTNGNYKVIFKFQDNDLNQVYEFNRTLNEVLESLTYYNLKTSVDVYNSNTMFVVIHGFSNGIVAENFDQLLDEDNKGKIKIPYIAIETPNYRTIQIHKNLDDYLKKDEEASSQQENLNQEESETETGMQIQKGNGTMPMMPGMMPGPGPGPKGTNNNGKSN